MPAAVSQAGMKVMMPSTGMTRWSRGLRRLGGAAAGQAWVVAARMDHEED